MTASDSHLKQTQHAMDTHSLDGLRKRAFKPDDKEALMEAAQQFEAIFLNMVMGSMRKANAVFEKDNLLDNRYTNMYRDMYDQQLTSELSSQGTLGLAELMVKQLGGDDNYVPASMHRNDGNLDDPRMKNRADMSNTSQKVSDQGGIDAGLYYGNQRVNTAKLSEGDATFDSPQSFIAALKPHAEKIASEAGLNPDVLMAQAALETGWGKRLVPGRHGGSSNNLFNIKADTRWDGDKSHVSTLEFDGEVARKERAAFRSYANVEQSLQDYVNFIKEHPRYQQALKVADDPKQYTQALQEAGYATDPQYAQKIQSVLSNPAFVDKEI
ncbi:flagellar assembly peptidoglycan hydrolase FlgJ [Idiomarina loihiensis]|uniref:flagellar assembly peptidoglycan hydrolase FlgJ n=1 Tax=Idiomarina loihiensis TaxID=135577 RepID=UPI00384FE51C